MVKTNIGDDMNNVSHSSKVLVLSNHIPIELVTAAGLEAVYPDNGIKGGRGAEAYLPRDFCPIIKSSLEQVNGGYCILSGCCDGQRRLHDVIDAVGTANTFLLPFPRNFRERTKARFAGCLRQLWHRLCTISGHEENDLTVLQNSSSRQNQGRLFLEKGINAGNPADNMPRLMLVGACMFDWASLDNMERLGGRVVALDFTAPYFCPPMDEDSCPGSSDPFMALAERYVSLPCPQGLDRDRRWQHLYHKYVGSHAEGIVYIVPQFCDQLLYEVAWIKKTCQAMGIPMIYIESEEGSLTGGQSRTRIEAFLEVIGFAKGKGNKICGI